MPSRCAECGAVSRRRVLEEQVQAARLATV